MKVSRKYRSRKIGAFALVFVLLLNTLTGALAPIYAAASENTQSILTDVQVTDETGNILGEGQNESVSITSADEVLVAYDWSLAGVDAQANDSFSYLLPMQLQVKEAQQGSLVSESGTEVATYQADLDGTVTIHFNEAAVDQPNATGSLKIRAGFDAAKLVDATETTLFQLAGTEDDSIAVCRNCCDGTTNQPTKQPKRNQRQQQHQPTWRTPRNRSRSASPVLSRGNGHTENIITDVDLLQRLATGPKLPGSR
jgi:hypothetical protein